MKKQDDRYFYLGNYPDNELGRIEDKNKYDNEEYVCDINSTTDAHAAIIRQIAEKSKVLDIGCASGLTGENLKRLKKCHIDGIEYDDKAIEFARKKGCYDNLSCFSITDTNSKEYKEFFKNNSKKYDYVVLCDVLEHLDKPWEVLINVKELLNKKGKILISIPNIAHIDVIKGLINGEFNYASLGILDSTHVRFFTESSFYDMIDNIYKFYNINFNVKLKNRIVIEPYYVSK